MKFRERWQIGALAGMLGVGGMAASQESQSASSAHSETAASVPSEQNDTVYEYTPPPLPPIDEVPKKTYIAEPIFEQRFQAEKPIPLPDETLHNPDSSEEYEQKKEALIDFLGDFFADQGGIEEGSEQGFGYHDKTVTINNTPSTNFISLTRDGKPYGSITLDEGGYVFTSAIGEKEISVDSLSELGSVLDEYSDNYALLQTAYDDSQDFETQLEARTKLEETTFFKSEI